MKIVNNVLHKVMMLGVLGGLMLWGVAAQADLVQIKAYKETYPDAKPKCIQCHVDKMPKKDDGAHDNNDYGKSVVAAAKKAGLDKPTADTYKAVGPIPATN
jgi:hypothetical protein